MDYTAFSTPLGWMIIAGSSRGIAHVVLPAQHFDAALDRLRARTPTALRELRARHPSVFGSLPDRLTAFMCGQRVSFPDHLDTSGWTDFQFRVWEATRNIPYGQTRSYSWVAASIGQPGAYRAVGQALHKNPVPVIVPCHRVVGIHGDLTGFGGGLALKQVLISLETNRVAASDDAV